MTVLMKGTPDNNDKTPTPSRFVPTPKEQAESKERVAEAVKKTREQRGVSTNDKTFEQSLPKWGESET